MIVHLKELRVLKSIMFWTYNSSDVTLVGL